MAILNHRDYRLAKSRLDQLRSALKPEALLRDIAAGWSSDVTDARHTALRAEYEQLRLDIDAYEKLKGQDAITISENLDASDLGLLPIVGRIARGLSQRELAERLKLKEQQIQRYERERYRAVSLTRYRQILDALRIELEARLGADEETKTSDQSDATPKLEFLPEVILEIKKRGWLDFVGHDKADEGKLLAAFVRESRLAAGGSFHRKYLRKSDGYDVAALLAWEARVLVTAKKRRSAIRRPFDTINIEWISELVKLSAQKDGPVKALDFLGVQGVIVVIEPHLPHTRLDGAAMRLRDGTPVIGLTLRYDRIDYFWFTLLHELAHVVLHSARGLEDGFFDDIQSLDDNEKEVEADTFARAAFISEDLWATAPARFAKSPDIVKKFAASLGIHPSIIAGRIRRERNDYSVFRSLIGEGEVRRLFPQFNSEGHQS